jgi:hypothetical protein
MRRLVATTGALTIVVTAGCGGGSTVSPPSSSTDAASAARINLRQSDFPAGWQGHPNPVTAPGNANMERTLYACLTTAPPDSHTTANIDSPAFVLSARQASSNVKLTRTTAQGQADYGVLAQPTFGNCARQSLLSTLPDALPAGSAVTSSSMSGVPATAPPGDRVTAAAVTVNVVVQGGRTTVDAEFTTILRGRAVVAVQTIGLGQPFPADIRRTIVANVENRADQLPS